MMFAGPPGQGKTTCGNTLVKIFYQYMHKRFPERFPSQVGDAALSYTKSQTSQFWERYAGHFATIHDEFMQSTEPMDIIRSVLDVTQMISSGSFALDMADLHMKGTCCFSSTMVLLMSNATDKAFQNTYY